MKISLAQINPTVGDLNYNYKLIIKHAQIAKKSGAEILITPELSICGYPPEDLLLNNEFISKCKYYVEEIAKNCIGLKLIVGYPRKFKGKLFNSASILYGGRIQKTYNKQILPNHGVFDEKRYFDAGNTSLAFSHKNKKFGILICEDIWEKGPIEKLFKKKIDFVICINASPYDVNKNKLRLKELEKRVSLLNNIIIIYVNLIGGQDDLLFDGGSFIYSQKNGLIKTLQQFKSINHIIETKNLLENKQYSVNTKLNKTKTLLDGLILALKDYVKKNSIKNIFIGLSGGIDSAVVLFIASKAFKKEKINALMMPSNFTSKASLEDAKKLSRNLGVNYKIKDIQPLMKLFGKTLANDFKGFQKDITEENIQARIRGVLLMAYANKFNGIVLSTSNKSEVAVGYSTVYGDMVGGFSVLKDVPKTLVYKIANEINSKNEIIPKRIIERLPSAELAKNQTDQDNLPDYDILDEILDLYVEKNQSPKTIIKKGFSAQIVKKVVKLVNDNEFKRRQAAPGPKVTNKAFGKDRRYPITSKYKP